MTKIFLILVCGSLWWNKAPKVPSYFLVIFSDSIVKFPKTPFVSNPNRVVNFCKASPHVCIKTVRQTLYWHYKCVLIENFEQMRKRHRKEVWFSWIESIAPLSFLVYGSQYVRIVFFHCVLIMIATHFSFTICVLPCGISSYSSRADNSVFIVQSTLYLPPSYVTRWKWKQISVFNRN